MQNYNAGIHNYTPPQPFGNWPNSPPSIQNSTRSAPLPDIPHSAVPHIGEPFRADTIALPPPPPPISSLLPVRPEFSAPNGMPSIPPVGSFIGFERHSADRPDASFLPSGNVLSNSAFSVATEEKTSSLDSLLWFQQALDSTVRQKGRDSLLIAADDGLPPQQELSHWNSAAAVSSFFTSRKQGLIVNRNPTEKCDRKKTPSAINIKFRTGKEKYNVSERNNTDFEEGLGDSDSSSCVEAHASNRKNRGYFNTKSQEYGDGDNKSARRSSSPCNKEVGSVNHKSSDGQSKEPTFFLNFSDVTDKANFKDRPIEESTYRFSLDIKIPKVKNSYEAEKDSEDQSKDGADFSKFPRWRRGPGLLRPVWLTSGVRYVFGSSKKFAQVVDIHSSVYSEHLALRVDGKSGVIECHVLGGGVRCWSARDAERFAGSPSDYSSEEGEAQEENVPEPSLLEGGARRVFKKSSLLFQLGRSHVSFYLKVEKSARIRKRRNRSLSRDCTEDRNWKRQLRSRRRS